MSEDGVGEALLELTEKFMETLRKALNNQIDEFLEDLKQPMEPGTQDFLIEKWEAKKNKKKD